MKVVVYVEGAGDRVCLETLLAPLIAEKNAAGIAVQFLPATRGDRKKELLINVPKKAAHAIRNDPEIVVVILPDLFPQNKAFPHNSCEELQAGVTHSFRAAIASTSWDDRLLERFRVFCLIHDLEVLLLAAEEALLAESRRSKVTWRRPVEDQNLDRPPKRVVEALIPGYDSVVDGPRILAGVDYRLIADRCPNGFGRFVEFLASLRPAS